MARPVCCRCCCATPAARDRDSGRANRGHASGEQSRDTAARRRAGRSRQPAADQQRLSRAGKDAALEAPARPDRAGDHRRQHDPAIPRRADRLHAPPTVASLGEFRASLAHLQGARQRDAAVSDAGHARSVVASARRVDHVVRDQATGGDARGRIATGSTSAATAGSRICVQRPTPSLVADDGTARRRTGAARRAAERQRLHSRAVD